MMQTSNPLENFRNKVAKMISALESASKHKIDLKKEVDQTKSLYSFREQKNGYYKDSVGSALKELRNAAWELSPLHRTNELEVKRLMDLANKFNPLDKSALKTLDVMLDITLDMEETPAGTAPPLSIKNPPLPEDIRADVLADINEIQKCFSSECYRSTVILCGRILETILHRKYYEATGNDSLEKTPGIGLGKLVAILKEKNVKLDPGLAEQIHLINQVRIFSVHKKQDAFYPSKDQAHAIILYTMDIASKLFRK